MPQLSRSTVDAARGLFDQWWWYLRPAWTTVVAVAFGITGATTLDDVPVIGMLGLLVSLAFVARDLIALGSPDQDMTLTAPHHPEWTEIDSDQSGAELVTHGPSAAHRWPAVDAVLHVGSASLRRGPAWQLPSAIAPHAPGILRAAMREDAQASVANRRKVRLASTVSPDAVASSVDIQETRYFNAVVTNQVALRAIEVSRVIALDIRTLFLRGARLIPLEHAGCSNHIGVSVLAVTRDRHVVATRQGRRSAVNRGAFNVSGSGSVDITDLKESSSLQELVTDAMRRELSEECGIAEASIRNIWLTGYARLLHRGGKPEFFGVATLDVLHHELAEPPAERGYTEHFAYGDVTAASPNVFLDRLESFQASLTGVAVGWPLTLATLRTHQDTGLLAAIFGDVHRELLPSA